VSAYPGGHAVFLGVALATHALVGYTLGAVLFARPLPGLVGGVVADVDLLVPAAVGPPFAHRGITHTALAAGVATAVAWRRSRATAGAVCPGYGSQLLIDATTPMGIPLLFPLAGTSVALDVGVSGHSLPATLLLWSGCLALLRHTGPRAAPDKWERDQPRDR